MHPPHAASECRRRINRIDRRGRGRLLLADGRGCAIGHAKRRLLASCALTPFAALPRHLDELRLQALCSSRRGSFRAGMQRSRLAPSSALARLRLRVAPTAAGKAFQSKRRDMCHMRVSHLPCVLKKVSSRMCPQEGVLKKNPQEKFSRRILKKNPQEELSGLPPPALAGARVCGLPERRCILPGALSQPEHRLPPLPRLCQE